MGPIEFDKETRVATKGGCEEPWEPQVTVGSQSSANELPANPASADQVETPDEVTGASPGTAQACEDLGLNSLSANLERFGIKLPGQS